jgi:S1-C subfamily serine protease
MRDRRNLILAVSLVAAFALVACSQDPPADQAGDVSTSSPVPTATSSVSPAQTPTAVAKEVEVTAPAAEPIGSTASTGEPAAREDAGSSPTVVTSPVPIAVPDQAANGTIPRADTAFQSAIGEELSTVDIVKLLRPSVVHIATTLDAAMSMVSQPVPEGVGTGVVLDEAGHILTNNHVIQDAQRIIVTLSDGQRYSAMLIGRDPRTDTAVIEIDATDLTPAILGVASELEVGEDVIAIGHALGLRGGPTVSKGVVSAVGRSLATGPQTTIVDLIQTDASINPGNSGGPLVNSSGEVVGINTAILLESQGIGFAINIDDARAVAEQLMRRGYVERGFMGFSPIDLTSAIVSQIGLELPADVMEGILIDTVTRSYPAHEAGLTRGDVIVEMGGQPIVNTGQLSKFLINHLPGETVDVTFYRGLNRMVTAVTLVEQPEAVR